MNKLKFTELRKPDKGSMKYLVKNTFDLRIGEIVADQYFPTTTALGLDITKLIELMNHLLFVKYKEHELPDEKISAYKEVFENAVTRMRLSFEVFTSTIELLANDCPDRSLDTYHSEIAVNILRLNSVLKEAFQLPAREKTLLSKISENFLMLYDENEALHVRAVEAERKVEELKLQFKEEKERLRGDRLKVESLKEAFCLKEWLDENAILSMASENEFSYEYIFRYISITLIFSPSLCFEIKKNGQLISSFNHGIFTAYEVIRLLKDLGADNV